jgi:hypothetical protein
LGGGRGLATLDSQETMSNIPIANKKRTSYENFIAECPWCGEENIFNRASDLQTFEPIAGHDVSCQSVDCDKPFRIVGDSVNSPHEMLIYDCYELVEQKNYMNCILILTQAYEVFFSLFFRVELLDQPFGTDLDQPFGTDLDQELADLNRLSEELHDKIKEHTFTRMRALFLQHMVTGHSPENLAEAAAVVAALPDRPGDPKDAAIESLGDAKLVFLLKALKATSIHTLRNRIVHKQAYRPNRKEVEVALKEARSILFPLTSHLRLYDDINWYMRKL